MFYNSVYFEKSEILKGGVAYVDVWNVFLDFIDSYNVRGIYKGKCRFWLSVNSG